MGCKESKQKKQLPERPLPEAPKQYERLQIVPQDYQEFIPSSEEIFKCLTDQQYLKLNYIYQRLDVKNLINITGFSDDTMKRAPQLQQMTGFEHWNVLHIAIYQKSLRAVRYLVEQIGIPLKFGLLDPFNVKDEVFGLKIAAIVNHKGIFDYLWNQYYSWRLHHLKEIVEFLVQNNLADIFGDSISQSYTTQCIFRYENGEDIYIIVSEWVNSSKKQSQNRIDYSVILSELQSMFMYTLIIASEVMEKEEFLKFSKPLIEKATFENFSIFKDKNPERLQDFLSKNTEQSNKNVLVQKIRDLNQQYLENIKLQNIDIPQRQSLSTYFDKNELPQFFKTIKQATQFYHYQDQKITDALKAVVSEYDAYMMRNPQITVYHDILFNGKYEDDLEEFISKSKEVGISFYHALEINDMQQLSLSADDCTNFVKFGYELCLKISIYLKNRQALLALLSLDHFWTSQQISSVVTYLINNLSQLRNHQPIVESFFQSNPVQKFLQTLLVKERTTLLKELMYQLNNCNNSLFKTSAFSVVYINLYLNKSTYLNSETDFTILLAILKCTDHFELSELVQNEKKRFEKLGRCIIIQNRSSQRYQNGMEILQNFRKLPQYETIKASLEASSMLFNESEIEDMVEEDQIQLQFNSQQIVKRESMVKGSVGGRIENMAKYISAANEEEIMTLFKGNKIMDALFTKPQNDNEETVSIYTNQVDESYEIPYNTLNIVQLLAALDMSDTAMGYFLKDHKVLTYLNQFRTLPGSILILNNSERFEEGASLILRILISWARLSPLHSILEGYPSIWTSYNLLTAVQVMIARQESDFLERILDMSVTQDLLQNASTKMRQAFIDEMEKLKNTNLEYIYQQFEQSGYLEKLQTTYELENLLPAIQDDNVDYLITLISGMRGIGDVNMSEIENFHIDGLLINGEYATIQHFNVVLLCILYEANQCLNEFQAKFPQSTREALKGQDTSDDFRITYYDVQFDTLGIALFAFQKKTDVLSFYLKQEGFIPSHKDLQSLIKVFIKNNNTNGLNLLLKSFNMQIVYSSMDYQSKQKPLIKEIITNNSKYLQQFLIRPYLITILGIVLENELLKNNNEILIQILKGMSDDEYRLLIYREKELIIKNLSLYQEKQIKNQTLSNILAKIKKIIEEDKQRDEDNY